MYAFISHSNRNMEQADTLRELFRRFGIDTWMAPYDIPASCSYMEAITQAISECGCFVLLLTKEAEASEHVNKEISVACNYVPREIVPISLGHVPVSKNLEYALANIQYKTVRKLDEYDDEMRKILQQVRAFLKLPEPPRQKPQRFALEDISVVDSGRYLYLGPGINQISIDRTSYFLYDKEKETIDLVYLSGLPAIQVIASIKCDPQDVLGSVISLSTDGRYFLLRTANKLSVADIYANPARWVAINKPLPVKRGEDIFYISWPKRDQFDLICGTVDGRTIRILAQIEMSVKPYAYLRRAEIKTEQPLGPLIGFRELNQIDWQLFHTADDRLIAWNPKDKVSEPGVNILKALQAKRPALPNGIDQFSPDDLMYYLLRPIGQLDFENITVEFLPENERVPERPVMMDNIDEMSGRSVYVKNARKLVLKNVEIVGCADSAPELMGVDEFVSEGVRYC